MCRRLHTILKPDSESTCTGSLGLPAVGPLWLHEQPKGSVCAPSKRSSPRASSADVLGMSLRSLTAFVSGSSPTGDVSGAE
jgi:hypothetical protein